MASHDGGQRQPHAWIMCELPCRAVIVRAAERSEYWDRGRGRDYYYDHGGETYSENFPG